MENAALTLVLPLLLVGTAQASPAAHGYRLPDGFLLGAGTSAYQSEGAWNEDGKGVSSLDYLYHKILPAAFGEWPAWKTGDVAADSYHRYKEDIDMAAYLGFNTLRVSLSWPRIFPSGRNDSVNARGVRHYHDVFDYMRARGIEPIVTMYHFDDPVPLQAQFKGWNGEQMPEVFAAYADFLFSEYGSKVKYWLTVNEAFVYCAVFSNPQGLTPPSHAEKDPQVMRCLHHAILGHALAYRLYDTKYRSQQHGLVGFGVGPTFFRAASDAQEDLDAAETANTAVGIGLSVDPFVFGDYPAGAAVRPAFTDEQKRLVKGSIDFAGINVYTGKTVNASSNATVIGLGGAARGPLLALRGLRAHGTYSTDSAWVLREMPRWFKQRYGDLPIFVTENGASTGTGLDDWSTRAVYCSAFLREMVAGIHEYKNNVIGYTMWSLIDSFEFDDYDQGWGLVHVDFAGRGNASLARTPKASAAFFRRLARTRVVPLVLPGSRPFGEDDDGPADSAASAAAALGPLLAMATVMASGLLPGTAR